MPDAVDSPAPVRTTTRRAARQASASGSIPSGRQLVGRHGEELGEPLVEHEPVDERARIVEAIALEALQLRQLVVTQLAIELGRYRPAVVERHTVAPPLPELSAGDLGRRRVLHQVEDRHGTGATEPRLDVLHADA